MTVEPLSLHQDLTPSEDILARLFRPTGVDGVNLRTGAYEDVVDGLGRFITSMRPEGAEVYRFPPVVSRKLIEKSGYLKSFPQSSGLRLRAEWRRGAYRGRGRAFPRGRRKLDARCRADRPAACARRLLSGL